MDECRRGQLFQSAHQYNDHHIGLFLFRYLDRVTCNLFTPVAKKKDKKENARTNPCQITKMDRCADTQTIGSYLAGCGYDFDDCDHTAQITNRIPAGNG